MYQVLVNGTWRGIHRDPVELANRIREYRRQGQLPPDTSVIWDIPEKVSSDQDHVWTHHL